MFWSKLALFGKIMAAVHTPPWGHIYLGSDMEAAEVRTDSEGKSPFQVAFL